MKRLVKALLFPLLLTCGNAYAVGPYVGGGIGSAAAMDAGSNVSDLQAVLASFSASSSVSYDETSPALSLGGGIDINPYLAAEIGIVYLGTYKLSATATSGFATVLANETDRVNAVTMTVIGKLPVYHKIKLIGKLGLAATSIESSCSVSGGGCLTQTDSGVSPVFGAGISMRPVRALEIRVDYTVYSDVGDKVNDYTAGSFGMIETSAFYHY